MSEHLGCYVSNLPIPEVYKKLRNTIMDSKTSTIKITVEEGAELLEQYLRLLNKEEIKK